MVKYSTCSWYLVRALESASLASCKRPATFIDSICPKNQPGKNKESRNEIQRPTDRIVSYCLALHTQNTGLRQVDLEPSPERVGDRINMEKQ